MKLHRAIVVDDEIFTRKGLLQLMDWEACGFEIVGEADNGEDALELIGSIHPDLVITDIRMPVLDGLELIRSVLERSTDHPAFIILSGYSDFAYAQQALRYGVHDFMIKPIDESNFSATLRRLSERLHREQQNTQLYQNHRTGGLLETLMMNNVDDSVVTRWEQQLRLGEATHMYYVLVELNDQHPWRSGDDSILLSLFQFRELIEQALHRLIDGKYPLYVHEHRNRIGLIVPDFFLKGFEAKVDAFMKALQKEIEGMKRDFLYNLVRDLLAKGVPIDGVGHQSHIRLAFPAISEIEQSIEKFASLGLDNQITELDMGLYSNDTDRYETIPESMLIQQAHRYRALFDMFSRQQEHISNVTIWGSDDGNTWLSMFPIARLDKPLLFDERLKAKYAYWALVDPSKVPPLPAGNNE
ncbi:endo-1,4-beta-xylanase [Paenibacillus sp. 1-18]|uniref:endo-1,4-beta-xylanase n=1 Tax=Paenibacillus sp. 1-18 TaxID=1333846 RepID=UPI00046ED550